MKIEQHEVEISGAWIYKNGKRLGDNACFRIEALVNSELQEVAVSQSGWEKLYRDPNDKRLWELSYPQSHMHGGAPPVLSTISPETAATKYNIE